MWVILRQIFDPINTTLRILLIPNSTKSTDLYYLQAVQWEEEHVWPFLVVVQLIHRLRQADISCTTTDRLFFNPLLDYLINRGCPCYYCKPAYLSPQCRPGPRSPRRAQILRTRKAMTVEKMALETMLLPKVLSPRKKREKVPMARSTAMSSRNASHVRGLLCRTRTAASSAFCHSITFFH